MTINLFTLIAAIIIGLVIIVIILAYIRRRRIKHYIATEYVNEQVYVGNIPYRVNEYDLKKYFSEFGSITRAKVVKNVTTGRSKGYAFVTFSNHNEALKALVADGREMKGRTMVVRIAKPR